MADSVQTRVLRVQSEERGSDQVAAALQKVAAGATAADRAVQKYAADAKSTIAPISDALARSQDDFSRATLSTAKSIQSLQNRIDPVARALSQYEAAQKKVNLAIDSGQLSAEKGATILFGYEQRYIAAAAGATKLGAGLHGVNDNMKLSSVQMLEATHVGREFVSMLAMGVDPVHAFTMEIGRIVTFFQYGEGGVSGTFKALGNGVKTFLAGIVESAGLIPAVGIGLAAVGTAGLLAFEAIHNSAKSADDALKDFKDRLDEIKKDAPDVAAAVQKIFEQGQREGNNVLLAGVQQTTSELQASLKQSLSTLSETARHPGFMFLGGSQSVQEGYQHLKDLVDEAQRGQISVATLRDDLAKIYLSDQTPKVIADIASKLLDASKDARTLQAALDAAAAAAGRLNDPFASVEGGKGNRVTANPDELLRRLYPDKFDELKKKLDQQAGRGNPAKATNAAQDALAQAQHNLDTAGLGDYAKKLSDINFQIDEQIRKNPQLAATWEKVRDAQIKALDINTTVVPLRQASEQIDAQNRLLDAQVASLGQSSAAAQQAAYAQNLINKFIAEGVKLTPELIGQIDQLAQKYGDYLQKNLQVERIKAGFNEVQKAGSSMIDSLVDKLSSGSLDFKSMILDMAHSLTKEILTLDFANPLKNKLYGQNNPTLSDVGGIGGFFGTLFGNKPQTGLLERGSPTNPMYVVPTTGLGGLFGGNAGGDNTGGILGNFLNGYRPGDVTSSPLPSNDNVSLYGKAIQSIESGGNYSALGPLTASGDRAYGAYQVMGANIGPWTQQVLGTAMTPDQFLASPSAQDSVFNKIFGGYASRFGPSGAAQAWFGGPGSVGRGGGAMDILGTSGTEYVAKFNSALDRLTSTTLDATSGLGKFGSSLMNWFPPAPSGGGGGGLGSIFGSLFGGGVSQSLVSASPQAANLIATGAVGLFADGTDFAPGGPAIVGERGPELVNLPRGSQVIPNHKLSTIKPGNDNSRMSDAALVSAISSKVSVNLKNVNVFDPSIVGDYLRTDEGERLLVNVARKNGIGGR